MDKPILFYEVRQQTNRSTGETVYVPAIVEREASIALDEIIVRAIDRGLIVGLKPSAASQVAEAIALQILGLILSFAGFDGEAAVQTETALQWTHLSLTLIPAGFMVLSMFMIWRYPITRDMYQKILRALDKQKQGLPLEEDEFSCL